MSMWGWDWRALAYSRAAEKVWVGWNVASRELLLRVYTGPVRPDDLCIPLQLWA